MMNADECGDMITMQSEHTETKEVNDDTKLEQLADNFDEQLILAGESKVVDDMQYLRDSDIGANDFNLAGDSADNIHTPEILLMEYMSDLKTMFSHFQTQCNLQLDRIAELYNSSFNVGDGDQPRSQLVKMKKRKYKKKPNMFKNLIMICMVIVLLMQIHMYILLYSKFNRVHREIRGLSCVIYGKNCPDSHTAYQCISNKIDFVDTEHSRSMELLHKDMEELVKAVNNISQVIYVENYVEDDKAPPNKPPRTGSIYPVNP